jgi:hypothetical protein
MLTQHAYLARVRVVSIVVPCCQSNEQEQERIMANVDDRAHCFKTVTSSSAHSFSSMLYHHHMCTSDPHWILNHRMTLPIDYHWHLTMYCPRHTNAVIIGVHIFMSIIIDRCTELFNILSTLSSAVNLCLCRWFSPIVSRLTLMMTECSLSYRSHNKIFQESSLTLRYRTSLMKQA